jgi:hypothetical protein
MLRQLFVASMVLVCAADQLLIRCCRSRKPKELVRGMPRHTYWAALINQGFVLPLLAYLSAANFNGDVDTWLRSSWREGTPITNIASTPYGDHIMWELIFVGILVANMLKDIAVGIPLSKEIVVHHFGVVGVSAIALMLPVGHACFIVGVTTLELGSFACNVTDLYPTASNFRLLLPVMVVTNLIGLVVAGFMTFVVGEGNAIYLFMFATAIVLCIGRHRATAKVCRGGLLKLKKLKKSKKGKRRR